VPDKDDLVFLFSLLLLVTRAKPVGARKLKKETTTVGVYSDIIIIIIIITGLLGLGIGLGLKAEIFGYSLGLELSTWSLRDM